MTVVRFCSACGTALTTPPPVTCDACGTSHWRNPKPCANAIVVDGDRVLLARRADAPWKGMWATPGGFCESGEHPVETVKREVFEELGLRVEVTGYIGVWVDDYADEPGRDDNEIINVAYYLAALVDDGSPVLAPAEVSELGWFSWHALPVPLAPPDTLEAVLVAAQRARAAPLLDAVPPVSP